MLCQNKNRLHCTFIHHKNEYTDEKIALPIFSREYTKQIYSVYPFCEKTLSVSDNLFV